jgi:hypothetical protein
MIDKSRFRDGNITTMAVLTLDKPSSPFRQTPQEAKLSKSQETSLHHFRESVTDIAMALGDLGTPLRRSPQSRDRLMVEDAYACIWKDGKQQLSKGDEATAKLILREQGCSMAFISALHSIMNTDVGFDPRRRDDQAQRFSVALRLAVHLSPDGGASIYEHLDQALHPQRNSAPLSIVNTYLAFKARKFGRES